MKTDVIVTKTAKIRLLDDGIVHVVNIPGSDIGLEEVKENINITEIIGGKKRPLLVDISKVKSVSREAREYFVSSEGAEIISGCAMLVGSPMSREIGNFFLDLTKLAYPIKLFTSEAEALMWLKNFIY